MKIDRSKVRKSQSELAPECQQLIQQLKEASEEELVQVLKGINTWYFGKCELSHWVDVLDRFDELLSIMAKPVEGFSWVLTYDRLEETEGPQKAAWKRELVNQCLRFTALLIEHSYTRQLYSSIEHLTALLTASDMEVVLSVLGVLYVFSKRSSFIPRLPADKRKALQQRLLYLAETWGGKENGFGLAHCCKDGNPKTFASSAGNLHFEFYLENNGEQKTENKHEGSSKESKLCSIHLENISQFDDCPGEIVEQLISFYNVPAEKQIALFSRARLAKHFPVYNRRLHCVQARLQAISILVYSNANQDVINPLLYQGLIEEVVEVLQLDNSVLINHNFR